MNKTNTITSTNAVGNVVDSFTDLVFEGLLTNYDALMWIIVLIGVGLITRWLVVSARADQRVMSPIMKTLTVVFGGMAVMVVTTVCGAMIGYNLHVDEPGQGSQAAMISMAVVEGFVGGVIGAVVGVPIWVWLGYMVCRDKKPAELPPGPPRQEG